MFPEFVLHQRGNAAIWVDRNVADQAFIDRLADVDEMIADAGCQIIKDQTKTKVGRLTVPISGKRRSLYVKRFNSFSIRHKLVSAFMQSGAVRSLRGAALLREAHIPTIVPVAAVENRRRGALSKSFFLSEEIAGAKTVDAYWREELAILTGGQAFTLRRQFLARLAALFHSMHDRGIYHNDLKDANILVIGRQAGKTPQLCLLDLEGVRHYARLSAGRKIKNLVQINRTLGRYLRQAEKLFFLKCYLGALFTDVSARRGLIRKVMKESRRVDEWRAKIASVRTREIMGGHG